MRNALSLISILAVGIVTAACGGADDPLGGPYGGSTGSNPAPNSGSGSGSGSSSGAQGVSGNDGNDAGTDTTGGGSTGGGGSSGGGGGGGGGSTGGGGGGGSTPDAGSSGGGGSTSTAPTWTEIYTSYLKTGTIGNCGASGCHSQMRSASGSYTWLSSKGQIDGTSGSAIGDPAQSTLSWMGGNMPKSGPSSNAAATTAVEAWAAAGALNN